ncbi:MAG: hypothetical protein LUQ37_05905 [Methanoregulaceae archaeon]|jgi:hypothetical protein|nr:hypothetical protein [Methanoregulaceae archaeon]
MTETPTTPVFHFVIHFTPSNRPDRILVYHQNEVDPVHAWKTFSRNYKRVHKVLPVFVKLETLESYTRSLS